MRAAVDIMDAYARASEVYVAWLRWPYHLRRPRADSCARQTLMSGQAPSPRRPGRSVLRRLQQLATARRQGLDPSELATKYRALSPAERITLLRAMSSLAYAIEDSSAVCAAAGDIHARGPLGRLLDAIYECENGLATLIRLRSDLLAAGDPQHALLLKYVTVDLKRWVGPDSLRLRRITWDSPASLLETVAQDEAVHPIADWRDLKNRLDRDRRVYGLFHEQLRSRPLAFVQVALRSELTSQIGYLLDIEAPTIEPTRATTAVFYSITNSFPGLAGINLGTQLIKETVCELSRELPQLRTFGTLSPVPLFRDWCNMKGTSSEATPSALADLSLVQDETACAAVTALCARYLVSVRRPDGRVHDPVANFHLSNGARLERINWLANPSAAGLRTSFGVMVNYVYVPDALAENASKYRSGVVVASAAVRSLAAAARA